MTQQPYIILLQGGLDLVTQPIAMPDGRAISCQNYEPDVSGVTSTGGYERYDGQTSPSSGSNSTQIAALRALIAKVPGSGPVRGQYVYAGELWAFRDQLDGSAAMFKATAAGWVQQTFGHTIDFTAGTVEFTENTVVTGGTSGATATIKRVVVTSGVWNGTAAGYLVVSILAGTFQAETITAAPGSATATAAQVAVALSPGGIYKFETHNFYGAAKSARLYFVNGIGTAFEWDGTVLAPIRTGIDTGSTFGYLMTDAGSPNRVLTDNGVDRIIVDSTAVDNPSFIGVYRNHLFFGYAVGAIVFSGPGVPLDYRTSAGAGTFAFGDAMTAMLVSATALVIFGRGLIEYVAGNDVDDFQKLEVTEAAGAVLESPQVYGESPLYLDDGGLRKLSSTAAYGDFKTGTVTQLLEPLFRLKRLAGVVPATALVVTAKDQYRLYWNDGSGVVLYMGRKYPESLPFKLPVTFFSSCVGELDPGMGDRLFAGGTDGYVYELDKGTSFDGAAIDAYIQIAYNNLNSPRTNKRFHRYFGDVVCPDPITVGVVFDVDYGGEPAEQTNADATAGMPLVGTDAFASIDWQRAVQGKFTCDLDGVGRNIAITHITSSSTARQHTFPSSTINYSPRGQVRQ